MNTKARLQKLEKAKRDKLPDYRFVQKICIGGGILYFVDGLQVNAEKYAKDFAKDKEQNQLIVHDNGLEEAGEVIRILVAE